MWTNYPYLFARERLKTDTQILNLMELIKNKQWSQENDVDLIKKLRDDLVKDFLDERYLKEFILENYNVRELSNVKLEFVKKELKELLHRPLDMEHYEPIFTHLRETGSDSLGEGQDQLFYIDIEKVLKRYIF
jgi:hypothetical protein